jgi:hypothetical protein
MRPLAQVGGSKSRKNSEIFVCNLDPNNSQGPYGTPKAWNLDPTIIPRDLTEAPRAVTCRAKCGS